MSNTETTAVPPAPQGAVTLDPSVLENMGKEIAALDEQISAASGSEAAIRNSVLNGYATESAQEVDSLIAQLLPQFGQIAEQKPAALIGLMTRLPEAMEEAFKPVVEQLVDNKVRELTSNSNTNVAPLREQRKAKVENFKAMRTVLDQFGIKTDHIPDPKRGGGRSAGSGSGSSTQKTGWNKDQYRYLIDGKPQSITQNTFSAWVFYATEGCVTADGIEDPELRAKREEELKKNPERWGVEQMREFLSQNGVKTGPPGEGQDSWEVTLPNGKKVGARRLNENDDKDIFEKVAEVKAAKESKETPSEEETPATA